MYKIVPPKAKAGCLLLILSVLSLVLVSADKTSKGASPAANTPGGDPPTDPSPAAEPSPQPDEGASSADKKGMVGMRLYKRNHPCFVHEVVPGGPAEAAGALPGDRLLAVDGEPIDELHMREITGRIKGPVGTKVTLTVQQPGQAPRDLIITRGILPKQEKKPIIATSALPRLKAFAHRQEIESMLRALEDVQRTGDPDELKSAYPLVVATLSREEAPEALEQARELLPQALKLDPTSLELAEAVENLFLKNAAPDPAAAQDTAEQALKQLKSQDPVERDIARSVAAWTAVQGQAELADGKSARGLRHLEQSLELQLGTRMALLDPEGKLIWASQLGPKDRWEVVANAYLSQGKPQKAANLAQGALCWAENPASRGILEEAGKQGFTPDMKDFTAEAWSIEPMTAPPLEMTDVHDVTHTLAGLHGKVVLVSLWATWCGPCHHELEALKGLYAEVHDKGFEILAVSQDQDTSLVAPFAEKKAVPFPIGLAPNRPPLYRSQNVPITYLIDRDGRLVWSHVGFSEKTFPELEETVHSLLESETQTSPNLIRDAYGRQHFDLLAHLALPRVVDVAVARGSDGFEIWAIRANGTLSTATIMSAEQEEQSLPLQLQAETERGFGRFNRVTPVDLDGDGLSERLLYRYGDRLVVAEDPRKDQTLLFAVAKGGVADVTTLSDGGEAPPVILIGYRGAGVRAIKPDGETLWWHDQGDVHSLVAADIGRTEGPAILAAEKGSTLTLLTPAGASAGEIAARGPADRVATVSRAGKLMVLVRDMGISEVVATDLDGDGLDEVAAVTSGRTLVVLDSEGRLVSRMTFTGERLSLASADPNGDGRNELIVGGEGIGLSVIGWRQ